MKKALYAVFFSLVSLFLFSCGKKGDPLPKMTIEVPMPEVEIELTEVGVLISNRSSEHIVVAQRAESEIGDLGLPRYELLARIQPSEAYLDNEVDKDKRYLYRFRSYYFRYNAYSGYVTQAVSYRGPVEIDKVSWYVEGDTVCTAIEPSVNTDSIELRLNGVTADVYPTGDLYRVDSQCYPLPPTATVIMMIIPYSESGTPGTVFSENIVRDVAETLLPPQNVRLIRRDANLTISWDSVPNASGYRVRGTGWERETEASLINVPASEEECTTYSLSTLRGGAESQSIGIESCP